MAVRGSSWQFVAVRGSSWQFVAVRGSSWQFVAVRSSSSKANYADMKKHGLSSHLMKRNSVTLNGLDNSSSSSRY